MIGSLFKIFAGRPYKKFLRRALPLVDQINAFEAAYQSLTDEQLKAKTQEFKARFAQGESLDALLPEAFAAVKNAARRLCGQTTMVNQHPLTWNMVHYDVQLIGGIALHQGKIAEMATGEGKTLVATCPLYLNALTGRNCQLVTVNDYLVARDAQWMGFLYQFLGLSVGFIQSGMSAQARKAAYQADITYGTASEFGFDYLRDNGMVMHAKDQVQRDHYFCIVDEVDSVLIDEARTPLIISGPANLEKEAPFELLKPKVEYLFQLQQKLCTRLINEAKTLLETQTHEDMQQEGLAKLLQVKMGMPKNRMLFKLMGDGPIRKKFDRFEIDMHTDFQKTQLYALKEALYFTIDEKNHQADLTELGRQALHPDNPDAFILPDLPTLFAQIDADVTLTPDIKQEKKQAAEAIFEKNSEEIHCLSQLLRAYCLYEKDVEYVVHEGKVLIVDENTGRIMTGRRWSEGLHQAIEAKESVAIQEETRTYATITIQNYFRLYDKLGGMTGTAETEAVEFYDIYKLEVMPIPTHKPCIRKDFNDVIYKTRREKYNAVIQKIKAVHAQGQPILVGTASVDASELLSKMLKREQINHFVLNAKNHAHEADIIAQAGSRSAVTIATNMAGRGTDIQLAQGVAQLGGLFVLGTQRHESRRIDRQLRGRCSRQGDPGMSQFFISLEDDLMRLFANSGPIGRILENSFEEGEALEHPLLNRSLQSAQKRVEEQNYTIRKRLLKYDDVLNKQREIIYDLRTQAIRGENPKRVLLDMVLEEIEERVSNLQELSATDSSAWDDFLRWLNNHFPLSLSLDDVRLKDNNQLIVYLNERIVEAYQQRVSLEEPSMLEALERYMLIRPIDRYWQEHLTHMDELRRSVSLRSYGQKDPLTEYKSEAFTFFQVMMRDIRQDVCIHLFRLAGHLRSLREKMDQTNPHVHMSGPGIEEPESKLPSAAPIINFPVGLTFNPKQSTTSKPQKIGRNDMCPCGSGKKYKHCCGAIEPSST